MNYVLLQKKAEDRISACPVFWAFSDKQFGEGCKKLGVTEPKKELAGIGFGGFTLKADKDLWNKALEGNSKERDEFLADMINLKEAFRYELGNHEYCITYDDQETWEAVGIDMDKSTPEQRKAFVEARDYYLRNCDY